jgi:alkylated DNA repair dioxygenase AlkB
MSHQLALGLGQPTPRRACDDAAGIPDVPGLHYFPGFLTSSQQSEATDRIDKAPWRDDLERRVQHYGWRYDYRARTVSRDMHIGPLPDWLQEMAERLFVETGLFDRLPDQAIVNEYLAGQGIAMHIDRQCFGPAVATISLGDAWRMDLLPVNGKAGRSDHILLEVGSALVMTGSARSRWLHGIAKRKREREGENWRPRQRRISLTFRTVSTLVH